MHYLITKWFGVFLYDGERIVKSIIFPKNEREIAERLWRIKKGEILEEERKILKGEKGVITGDKRLSQIAEYSPRDSISKISIEPESFGFNEDILRRASLIVAEKEISENLGKEDLQIMQMVRSIDELIPFSNILSERLREWKRLSFQDDSINSIIELKNEMEKSVKVLEKRIEENMQNIAPNLSEIAGAVLGARLITLAGGLERLATMPASAIQVIGAEKALFRYKAGEGTPPKHGVIYQHPLIRKSKKNHRGKIARVLANTIATAVKADAFTKRMVAHDLKERMERRIKEIKEN